MKRAFRAKVQGFPDSVIAADSASKARAICWRGSQDAGYCHTFGEIQVSRDPQFDSWAATDKSNHAWNVADLNRVLARCQASRAAVEGKL